MRGRQAAAPDIRRFVETPDGPGPLCPVEIESGKTTRVELRTEGRTVIGRFKLDPRSSGSIDFSAAILRSLRTSRDCSMALAFIWLTQTRRTA